MYEIIPIIIIIACLSIKFLMKESYEKAFLQALNIIHKNYIKKIQLKNLVYDSLKKILSSLDSNSYFLTPTEYKLMLQNKFINIGIKIKVEDRPRITSICENSLAKKAGLKVNDIILEINNKSTKNMDLTEINKIIKSNEQINLLIKRDNKVKKLNLQLVTSDVIEEKIIDNQYIYIRIFYFEKNVSKKFIKTINELRRKYPIKGIILDLRNNFGGLLDEAIEIANKFIDSGKIIIYIKKRHKKKEVIANGTTKFHYPLIVLIDKGTISSAEALAASLQDHHKAILIGKPSFGKDSIQTIFELKDGSALWITTGYFIRPNGQSIKDKGVMPDLIVEDNLINVALKVLKRNIDI